MMTYDIHILNSQNNSVQFLINKDKKLKKVIELVGEISYKTYQNNKYEFFVDTIIGQMLSKKVATVLSKRIREFCKADHLTPEHIDLTSYEELRNIGLSNSKIDYIRNFTQAIKDSTLDLDNIEKLRDDEIIKQLTKVKGIGIWSAKMFLIFVLNRQNILPFEDGAFQQSFSWLYNIEKPNKDLILQKCKKWSPYASIASRYMYKALDLGLTKKKFKEY